MWYKLPIFQSNLKPPQVKKKKSPFLTTFMLCRYDQNFDWNLCFHLRHGTPHYLFDQAGVCYLRNPPLRNVLRSRRLTSLRIKSINQPLVPSHIPRISAHPSECYEILHSYVTDIGVDSQHSTNKTHTLFFLRYLHHNTEHSCKFQITRDHHQGKGPNNTA